MRTKKEWIKLLGKTTYHKVYNQISMRFRRADRKNWKTIRLGDLTFSDALEKALFQEQERQKLGVGRHEVKAKPSEPIEPKAIGEPRNFVPSDMEKYLPKPTEPHKPHDNMGFDNLEGVLNRAFSKSEEEKVRENKELERGVNEVLEKAITRNICSKCKSSVCHCHDNEEGETE